MPMNMAARAACAPGADSRHGRACRPAWIASLRSECQAGEPTPLERFAAEGLAESDDTLLPSRTALAPQRLDERAILGKQVVSLERRWLVRGLEARRRGHTP